MIQEWCPNGDPEQCITMHTIASGLSAHWVHPALAAVRRRAQPCAVRRSRAPSRAAVCLRAQQCAVKRAMSPRAVVRAAAFSLSRTLGRETPNQPDLSRHQGVFRDGKRANLVATPNPCHDISLPAKPRLGHDTKRPNHVASPKIVSRHQTPCRNTPTAATVMT